MHCMPTISQIMINIHARHEIYIYTHTSRLDVPLSMYCIYLIYHRMYLDISLKLHIYMSKPPWLCTHPLKSSSQKDQTDSTSKSSIIQWLGGSDSELGVPIFPIYSLFTGEPVWATWEFPNYLIVHQKSEVWLISIFFRTVITILGSQEHWTLSEALSSWRVRRSCERSINSTDIHMCLCPFWQGFLVSF